MSTHALFSLVACAFWLLPASAQEAPLPGYTIPLVDLAGETHRQTLVDREAGQYLGHPTTVLLEDDSTMLAVYPKRPRQGRYRDEKEHRRRTDLERATAGAR